MIPLDPSGAPRKAKDLGRWMRWVEDQLKLRGSNRGIIERGSVAGGVVTIREILTNPNPLLTGEDRDRLRLGDLGIQVWTLLANPVDKTLVVRFHPDAGAGIEWKRGEHYTLNDNVVTITAAALAAAGAQVEDMFSAQYLRLRGADQDSFTIDYAADGWSYLALPGSPDDNTADYSLAAFATWPTGKTPIGNVDNVAGGGPVNTHLDTELMWVARQVPAASSMTIKVRVEDNCGVYVNGTLVGSVAEQGSGSAPEATFEVPTDVLNSDVPNLIAVRVADETPIVTANISFDAKIMANQT